MKDKNKHNVDKNLPAPDIIAKEISENLQSALEQFKSIEEDLEEK